jgi:predicted regulator of Ras-like GTPase activity (Roadblock/LC7/MglB family)
VTTPLRSVLQALTERPDVAGAIVVSDEGLVVEAMLPATVDRDAVAALGATALRAVGGLVQAAALGETVELVVEASGGTVVVQRLPGNAGLVVLAAPEGDLGTLLYELRRHGPALTPLV